jgi:hypothetical protein
MLGPAMPTRLVVIALLLSGCAKKGAADGAAAPESEGAAPQGIEELEADLSRYESELRMAGPRGDAMNAEGGVETPGGDATRASDEASCSRVCDLATAICGLQDQICGLAGEHEGEARYAASCERATESCDEATEACNACRG